MTRDRQPSSPEIVVGEPARFIARRAPDTARFSLRIDPAGLAAASRAFGSALSAKIGDAGGAGERRWICLGPDEWLLTAPLAEAAAIEDAFAALDAAAIHSIVDIGHREVAIIVEGPDAALALRSAIAFDIDAMPVGSGRRTIFDRAQILLTRESERRFRIEVWRSFADHVWRLLAASAREIEAGV